MITGVLDKTKRPVLFTVSEKDFRFCFMTDSVYKPGESTTPEYINNIDGFIYGKTHDNHDVAIFIGNHNLSVFSSQRVTVGAYIVSPWNLDKKGFDSYTAITFSGGSLNSVFQADRLELSSKEMIVSVKDDKKSYKINCQDEIIEAIIQSGISVDYEKNGKSLRNTEISLTLRFEKPHCLNDIFRHYRVIIKTLSFMCFRKNVGVERIQLLKPSDNLKQYEECVGEVYIYDDRQISMKDWARNLCIDDLGESFPKLLELFYDEGKESKAPVLSFIPDNDADVFAISPSKVKEICSALEFEYEQIADISKEENQELEDVKKLVREMMKKYKNDNPAFSLSTYNTICSNIEKWSLTLYDRIYALSMKFKDELLLFNKTDTMINEEALHAFVKFRNGSTHSNAANINVQIADTAINMQALVYFCILDRLMVPRTQILELCKIRLIN